MAQETGKNIKLGIFVATGTVLFIIALYLVGNRQNMFSSNLKIKARFRNVSGLMEGNNVRFGGIDIGSVKQVTIASDTDVLVEMIIDKRVKQFLHRNAIASVGTDGLMGNRIVNITPAAGTAPAISDGDMLASVNPLETEEMMRSFNETGKNMKQVTENLSFITNKLRQNNTFWSLLADTTLPGNLRAAAVSIKVTGRNAAEITGDLKSFTDKIEQPNNFVSLITDTVIGQKLRYSIVKLETISDTAARISGDISSIARKMNGGKGTAALLLNDTAFAGKLNQSLDNIQRSSARLEEDLEGLKHSFLLRKYFRKKAKEM